MIALHLHDFYGASVVLSARHVKHHFLQNKRSKQKPFWFIFCRTAGFTLCGNYFWSIVKWSWTPRKISPFPRVYLKTHDVTGSEGFLRCARHFFAGILTYFKEKWRGAPQKGPLSGCVGSFQIRPRFILSDQRDEWRKLFVECLLTIAAAPHSDP